MTTSVHPEKSRQRMKRVVFWLAVSFSSYSILQLTGVISRVVPFLSGFIPGLAVLLYPPVYLAIHLGFLLAFTYILVPAGKAKGPRKVPWYDWVLMAIGLGWNLYLVVNFDDIYLRSNAGKALSWPELITAWVFFFVVFEAARRTLGIAVSILGLVFLVYPIIGQYLPGLLLSPAFSFDRVARGIGLFVTGMYGDILNISATIVFSFILFGQFLQLSGAGNWFIQISNAVLGTVRGGSAKVAVVANGLMGMVQGAAVAIVATVGTLAIPMMKKNGYKPEMAGAIEAVAANGGQIMPPVMGIAAFIMVDFLGVGYDRIVLAGILPAIVYYAALFFQIDFEAAKNGLKGLPRNELPSLRKTIIDGWYYLLPIAALLFFLLYFQFSASLSAMGASIVIIAVSYFKKQTRIGLNKFGEGLKTTATSMMMIAVMCATAGIIVGSVQLTGLAFRLSGLLTAIAGGNIAILLVLTAVVAIILGMGMPTSAVYVILATLVAPTMVKMGIVPMAAHFFLFYYGVIALITPPVCPASYVSAAIANSPPMKTGWLATRIGIAGFVVPFVFVFKPEMLLQGSIVSGLLVGLEATVIVLALSSGLGGYLWRPINIWQRVMITVGGFTMLYPYSSWATVTGLVFIAIPVFLQLVPVLRGRTRRDKHS